MSIEFSVTAAEQFKKRAEEAVAQGNSAQATKWYNLAAKNYRKAAMEAGPRGDQYNALAEVCEAQAQSPTSAKPQNSSSGIRGNQPFQGRPSNSPIGGSSVGGSPIGKSPIGGVSRDNAEKDDKKDKKQGFADASEINYEGYDLEITPPVNSISFDDLVGLEDAKRAIKTMLINPIAHREEYEKYGLEVGGMILMYGEPGTGKTTFAKAVASQLGFPFIAKDCVSLVDKFIGETGKKITSFLKEVRRFIKEQNTPVILYLDEMDQIAKVSDGSDKTAQEAVPALKTELDGFSSNNKNLIIIASTNYVKQIDPAILDRFNRRIYIPLPDATAREQLFKMKLGKTGISQADLKALDFTELAAVTEGFSGRDINAVVKEFLCILADRDSGELAVNEPLQAQMLRFIEVRKSLNASGGI